jgi:CTP:molybdopterin cytidylyltransferase MocA
MPSATGSPPVAERLSEVKTVITAGGRIEEAFAAAAGTAVKALAPLGAGALIDVAIEAARGAGCGAIAVVGGAAVRAHCAGRVERFIDESPSGAENVRRALEAWPGEPLLYLTSDIPFVTAAGLRDFLGRAQHFALAMAIADAGRYARAFPGAPPHEVRLGGERFANGSVFRFAPGAPEAVMTMAGSFFDARKDLRRLAGLLGPRLAWRFVTGRLRIADVERRARDVLGVPVAAIRACDPGLCYDVDTLEDWEYARTRPR